MDPSSEKLSAARWVFGRVLDGLGGATPAATDEVADFLIAHRLAGLARREGLKHRKLEAAALLAKRRAAASLKLLKGACGALAAEEFVVVKGVPQAVWLHGDASLRPSGDLDLLIERPRFQRIKKALEAAGFAADVASPAGLEVIFRRGGEQIDVHVMPWSDALSSKEVVAGAERMEIDGIAVPVAAKRHRVGLMVGHLIHDLGRQLIHHLELLMAAKEEGVVLGGSPEERLILRDVERWLQLGPCFAPSGGATQGKPVGLRSVRWALLDAWWRKVGPGERARKDDRSSYVMDLYVEAVLRPGRSAETLMRALWPAVKSDRWKGEGWRLGRIKRMLGL